MIDVTQLHRPGAGRAGEGCTELHQPGAGHGRAGEGQESMRKMGTA
jgi:hypothetical protein